MKSNCLIFYGILRQMAEFGTWNLELSSKRMINVTLARHSLTGRRRNYHILCLWDSTCGDDANVGLFDLCSRLG